MELLSLSPKERERCTLIRDAGISNHFAEERLEIDRKISKTSGTESRKQVIEKVILSVRELITTMEQEHRADVTRYDKGDRDLVRYTFLFDIFHEYIEAFDRHISDQIHSDKTVLPVSFATEAFSHFKRRGFTHEEAELYFAVFFQLRRGYYFIEKQLVGISPCMQELRTSLWNNIFTCDPLFYQRSLLNKMEDFSTLILGDTGTGKGTAASAIGRSGFIPFNTKTAKFTESFTRAFVSLNLSQFSEGIIESELFGHKKGAFTGAIEAHKGIFDICSPHGSIFLDEIGDTSIPIQIKLLQVLQERRFSPIGSHEKKRFSGRVIAATNKDLTTLRAEGVFRNDFYYRLCSDIITMPTLSARIHENPLELDNLIAHLVFVITGAANPELTHVVKEIIDTHLGSEYPWPGNVRECEQCVRRIIIRREYNGDHSPNGSPDAIGALVNEMRQEVLSADNLLSRYCRYLYTRHKSYEMVSRIVKLDRRTVKRYITEFDN